MKIELERLQGIGNEILTKWGFSEDEATYTTNNWMEGEMMDKRSHGFSRLPWIKKKLDAGQIHVGGEDITIEKETANTLLINGHWKIGYYVLGKAVDRAIVKCTDEGVDMVVGGITNTPAHSGLIGYFARQAAEQGLIYIGFNNSPAALVPHGASEGLWGTNPFTVGIPATDMPIILDMASTKVTYGDILIAAQEGKNLPNGAVTDSDGHPTTDANEALAGWQLPIAGHKGSGLGFIVELMAGALTKSMVGRAVEGGWGSSFILIRADLFRSLESFKKDVDTSILDLKSAKKAEGVKEIFFPGERSQKLRRKVIKSGKVEISDKLHGMMLGLLN